MPEQNRVNHDVVELVNNIISKQNLKSVYNIEYNPGSDVGDGYASQTIAVNIETATGSFVLFLKCALNIKPTKNMPIDRFYANEIYFYDVVYPEYRIFLKSRNVTDGFRHAPKCYGTSKKNILALENLKKQGFTLFNRSLLMNDKHITMVLKTFAKFHAISFAFKDQDKGKYEQLVEKTFDFFSDENGGDVMSNMIRGLMKNLLNKLDPVKDKNILERIDVEDVASWVTSADKNLNEYSILTQGDCWCSNMMFLYKENNKEIPIDIMLIDWQALRPASPVFDISYFFFSIASQEALDNTNEYLKIYHKELSSQIRLLGSDPDVLYPFSILEEEWKQHCKYGFGMAILIIKGMLSAKDEALDIEKIDFENKDVMENLYPKFDKEDEYINRIRILAKFLLKNNYI